MSKNASREDDAHAQRRYTVNVEETVESQKYVDAVRFLHRTNLVLKAGDEHFENESHHLPHILTEILLHSCLAHNRADRSDVPATLYRPMMSPLKATDVHLAVHHNLPILPSSQKAAWR